LSTLTFGFETLKLVDLVGKLVKVNGAGAVLVHLSNHLFNLLLLGLEAKGPHGHLKLLCINEAGAVGIEKIEGLAYLVLGKSECLPCVSLP
jgi:hypothetical protein